MRLDNNAPVEPLVQRAKAGDCIEVTLRNRLPATAPDLAGWQDLFWVRCLSAAHACGAHSGGSGRAVIQSVTKHRVLAGAMADPHGAVFAEALHAGHAPGGSG